MADEFENAVSSKAHPLADGELAVRIIELVQSAFHYKRLKRGANETTKTVKKGQSSLVVMAADADPIEILMHLPPICEEKNVPYVFISSMVALGRACGIQSRVICCTITMQEQSQLNDLIAKVVEEIDTQ